MDNSKINAKIRFLETQRKNVDQVWDIIRKFVMPMRSDFFKEIDSEHSVEWRQNRQVFDSTASDGLDVLSSSLHGSLTSPAIQWFELSFRNPDLNKDQEAREWLENAAKITYDSLQDSNFNLEANETYMDLVGYGSSVIVEEEDDLEEGAVHFKSIPLEECYFEEGHRGQVVNFYRRLKWTALQIVDKFGDQVPERIKKAAADVAQADTKFKVVFCVFTRDSKRDNVDFGGVLAPLERPYGKKYIMYEGGESLGEEGGYYEMPAFVPRWRKAQGSQWGFGPSHLALPDVLTCNELVMMTLRSVEKVVDPAIMITERGLISDIDIGPAGLTVVRDLESMKPFESRARFDVSELRLEKIQAAISRTYYVDQLQMKDSPAMTATEVQVRYELMQRLLGPTLGRLENDFLSPMVKRTFYINLRAGKFGEMPEVLLSAEQSDMDITYTGPLARAQRVDLAGNIERWVGSVGMIAEAQQEVLDIPDWDEMTREQGKLLGVPARLMKSNAKVTSIRQNREKQNQAAQQVAMQEAMGNAKEAQGKGDQAQQEAAS